MANAVVSSVNDVNSTYWNPAGLLNIERDEISLMHSNYFANIANYNFISYAKSIDNESAIGFSLIRFAVDDIMDTTQLIDNQGNIDFNRIELLFLCIINCFNSCHADSDTNFNLCLY